MTSKVKAAFFAVSVVSILLPNTALAWNLRGHMMVAAIAWERMKPETRARATALLKLNPDFQSWIRARGVTAKNRDEVAFVRAPGWPDDIRKRKDYTDDGDSPEVPNSDLNLGYSDKLQHRYWHYIDIPFSTDGTPVVQALSPNAETQIKAFRDTIASDSATDELKSYDLVWLLHLIGDIHQPLHATSRFSHDLPKGDRGGNEVRLCKQPCRDELHAFWDDLLGNSKSPIAAIKAGEALSPASAESDQDIHAWIEESFEAAEAYVYVPPIGPGRGPYKLTAEYKRVADKIGEERVAIAGARLARFLDDNLH